ncbi:glycoside hydrolase family 43 protein [Chloroflexota bacterium]
MKLNNPVIAGFYPDPSVCRVGEDYYLVTSTFEYFPGVPIFHSRDLVNWRQIGHCLTRPSQLPLENMRSSGGIYAPTIRFINSRFYMITTLVTGIEGRGSRHFYVYADDPAGEWSEPVFVSHGDLSWSIDPSLFRDDDGKVYFMCNGPGGLYQAELDLDTGEHLSDLRLLWAGTGGKYPEGSHLYKINGLYMMTVAEGGTEYGHMVTVARSTSPWGPFEPCPYNPVLTQRSTDNPIQATGHAELVQAHNGSWWLFFLGIRPNGYPSVYHLGRETFLAPVTWTDDGWPVVGENGTVHLTMDVDNLPEAQPWPPEATHDDFDPLELALYWNFLRNPRPEAWSLTARPGWLRLRGLAATLDDVDAPAFIGRRQRYFDCRVRTRLDFNPKHNGEEAGLVVLMNERHHYEIALRSTEQSRQVIVRRRIGSLVGIVAQAPIFEGGPVTFQIDADRDWYHLSYEMDGQAPVRLASGETRYLATEVAGGFTGVYFGMYATGNGRPCSTPADFDWFDVVPNGSGSA